MLLCLRLCTSTTGVALLPLAHLLCSSLPDLKAAEDDGSEVIRHCSGPTDLHRAYESFTVILFNDVKLDPERGSGAGLTTPCRRNMHIRRETRALVKEEWYVGRICNQSNT